MFVYLILFVPAGLLLAAIYGLIARFLQRITFRRGTVIAEYKAPELLSAAELGYLVDKDFGNNELLATSLSLVARRLVDLEKHKPGNPLLIARDDVKDSQLKELGDDELAVWSWIRGQHLGSVAWLDISGLFSKTLGARASYEQEVRHMLIEKGYLYEASPFGFKSISRNMYYASVIILLLVIASCYLVAAKTDAASPGNELYAIIDRNLSIMQIVLIGALSWLPLVYYLRLLYLTYYYAANQPIGITGKFRREWHEVAGFQLFIKTVEFSRLDADTNPYDASMAYAVALGFNPNMDKMAELAQRK